MEERRGSSGSFVRWAFWVFAAVGAYSLVTEHRAHLIDYLPYILLMACPVMHLFGHRHRGHGRDSHDEHQEQRRSA